MEKLYLKWGTVKGWEKLTEQSVEILQRYFKEGVPFSAMADHPDEDRKQILCELINQFTGEIWNDWSGEKMTKDEAKQYVVTY